MEAWSLIVFLAARHVQIDAQSEDACVIAAKAITLRLEVEAVCVNSFDGRVLWFTNGRQT